jgi:hypothetical protein
MKTLFCSQTLATARNALIFAGKVCFLVIVFAFLFWANDHWRDWNRSLHGLPDVPIHPAAEQVNVTFTKRDDEWCMGSEITKTITFQTKASPEEVLVFYREWGSRHERQLTWGGEEVPGTIRFNVRSAFPYYEVRVTTRVLASGLTSVEVHARLFHGDM